MGQLNKEKLLNFMTMRMDYLLELYERDFGGNPEKIYWQRWELKYWQECILRGEFDFVSE